MFNEIPVTRSHIINCAFSSWYPKYKKYTPKSKIIKPLPQAFIDYLSSDGIDLPDDGHYPVNMGDGDEEYSDWSEDDAESSDEEEPRVPKKPVSEIFKEFQEVHDEIKDTIKEWGPVTPKLNWSAPRDATWILATNTMKCENASDVYLLLNASNYIMHDLTHAFSEVTETTEDNIKETQQDYELVLRKWFSVNPALEFRVFVKFGRIVGVTQRDLNYYDYLENLKRVFRNLIDDFFEDVLVDTFPDSNYVFDVYLPRPFQKVYLLDINPFSRTTDPQLFTWHEITEIKEDDEDDYEFRLVTETNKGRFAVKEHTENQVPKDVVDASLDSSAMAELAKEWKELQMKAEKEEIN